ncbi:MAG: hypothetical protein ACK41C_11650 [Phenylobacterium sp.]|uniref:hypothetical protein n=1 Tax=Phenylobacterium sp. TaxID=1871053 RepID=UPI00391A6827
MSSLDRMWSASGAVLLALSMGALWVWPKFMGLEVHPIFGWAEALTGLGWLEPGARWVIGGLAALIIVLLLIPASRMIGAWAAFTLSIAFVVAHFTPWLGVNIPNYGPLMDALAAGRSVEEIRAMGLKGDMGAHFTMALINAGLAVVTIGGEHAARAPRLRRSSPQFA